MRSPSCILLCLSAVCLFALAASITLSSSAILQGECGPAGSGLPRCNGTIMASYDALNCQGNVTYRSGSSEEAVTGQCLLDQSSGPTFRINDQCAVGQPATVRQYAYTPNNRGNCTQPLPLATVGSSTAGACINDHSSNTSQAMLCDLSQVPFPISTTVTAGPVLLQPISSSSCYAPDRCNSLIYTTTYSDEHCGRSISSVAVGEPDLKLGICYDYRTSVSGESRANFMYSFDGTYFRIAGYYSGCSGPLYLDYKILVNTCFISSPGESSMFKIGDAVAPTPVSQSQDPTGASSSMHGSLQMSIFVSLMVSFIAMLLSVTA